MTSLILRVTTGAMLPGLLLVSLWMLVRGHDAPGGGFIAGLIAAAGFALRLSASGTEVTRAELRISPRTLIGVGLLVALLSALLGLILGEALFEAHWLDSQLPVLNKLGTPVLFDCGIYLLVIGSVLAAMLALTEVEG